MTAPTHQPQASSRLEAFVDGVWIVQQPLRFLGAQVGARMTVVRLDSGALWVHSPVAIDDQLFAELTRLGPIQYLVAPNRLHHLYVADLHRRVPEARLYLAPGLPAKRPDLSAGTEIDEAGVYPWSTEIAHHCVAGLRVLGEVSFWHRSSRTLILTDLAFNIGSETPFFSRQAMWLNDAYGRLRCPRDVRWLFLADRAAFAQSVATMAQWDFDRVILAHGQVVRSGGRQAFEDAFAFARDR